MAVWLWGFSPPLGRAEEWNYPLGVAALTDGAVLLADKGAHAVWRLQDGQLTALYQGLKKFRTPLNAVYCVYAAPTGTVYVGDSATREVYSLDSSGKLTALTSGRGADVPADQYHPGEIGIPTQIAVNSQGEVFTTDLELQRVWKIPAAGGTPQEFAVVAGPRGVAVDAEDHVWILSPQTPQLRRISPDGQQTEVIVKDLVFDFPHQVVLRPDGRALVTDGYAKTVWLVSRDGQTEKLFSGAPLSNPVGMCLIEGGAKVLVIDPRAPGLFEIGEPGQIRRVYPPEGAPAAAAPSAGPEGAAPTPAAATPAADASAETPVSPPAAETPPVHEPPANPVEAPAVEAPPVESPPAATGTAPATKSTSPS
jgi:hypothetical protein